MDNITWIVKDDCGIEFLAEDDKNRILTSVDNDGIGCRFVHTKLEIKNVIHDGLLPTDILHHPAGQ